MESINRAKEELINELEQLRKQNLGLEKIKAEYERTKKTLQISNHLLDISFKYIEVIPLLKEFVVEVKKLTGCTAVGIRMLDEEGNIPYQAYKGFSQRFYESESPLSIKSDQCMCVNVIKGVADANLPYYTRGGSFYMNGTTRFLATVSEEVKGHTRNVCNELGYESVALIPIRMGDHIFGLIHIADSKENMVPLTMVEMVEGIAVQLGTAIERVRSEERVKASLKEKEVLLKEIHHRIKNNLQVISSLCDMCSLRTNDQQTSDLFADTRAKIHTMALIHSQLYQSGRFDQIEIINHVRELIDYLSQIYAKGKKITIVVEDYDVHLSLDQAIPCALVLNELIANALKHAFTERQKGMVEVSIKKSKDDTIIIRIEDDGIGIPDEVDIYKTDSMGLKLIRNIVHKQLKGKIQVKRNKGTEFTIEFKILKEEVKYA